MSAEMSPLILLFNPNHDDGGVERILVNLANGLVALGHDVWMMTGQGRGKGAYLDQLAQPVHHVGIPASLVEMQLAQWVSEQIPHDRPLRLMAAKDSDEPVLVDIKRCFLALYPEAPVSLYAMLGTPLLVREQQEYPLSWRWRALVRRYASASHYAHFAGIMAICEGVRDDFIRFSGMDASKVHLVHNPVIDDALRLEARQPVQHPWLHPDAGIPVIMAIGRMSKVKDFSSLLAAFARLRTLRQARLVLVGDGRQKKRLAYQAQKLGVSDDVDMPGFMPNPYASLSKAQLLVVSSRREGGPNVLIEAMALGVPVVSTDCPYGPREILDQGRLGALVPVGHVRALADAMMQALDSPPDSSMLKQGALPYERDTAARTWAKAMDLA
ncbi:MAG: hypothetical protein RIQ52_587 [Pseudomonadota bacterium]|jgi:glycosyltransferase involved in cell wall biosynthesis